MKSSTFSLRTVDGVELFVYAWLPDGKVRGVLQIVHGMAEHAARYADTAAALAAEGWAVYAADNRGHGRTASEGDRGHLGDEGGWSHVLTDLKQLCDHAHELHPGVPYVLMGHSLGSFFVQSFLYTYPGVVDAAVLSGTNGDPGPLAVGGLAAAKLERLRMGKRGRSALLDKLSFGAFNKPFEPVRTGFDWLSRDTAQVDRYVADPLCGFFLSAQAWIDVIGGLRENAKPANHARIPKDLPVYLFAGARDPVGNQTRGIAKLVAAYKAAGVANLEERFYPDGRHEMVNEINREEVWRDLAAWLARVPPLYAS